MKRLKRIIMLAGIGLILSIGIILFKSKSYTVYVIGEYLGLQCGKIELSVDESVGCLQLSLDQLESDGRVTFDQSMMLVNTEYRLPDDFIPQISEYKTSGVQMSNSMQEAYEQLSLSVTETTGDKLYVSSHFRTAEKQLSLYEEDATTATEPGASEHQTGLALDVYVANYSGAGFIQSEAGQYVNSNSWKYGFIIRYPSFGFKETGIKYEPWHIRYVGQPHAEIVYNNHMTLEEYIESMDYDVWYEYDEYVFSRQRLTEENTLKIPVEFSKITISPDNTGSYIITAYH